MRRNVWQLSGGKGEGEGGGSIMQHAEFSVLLKDLFNVPFCFKAKENLQRCACGDVFFDI